LDYAATGAEDLLKMIENNRIVIVLGIRPDVIRASLVINKLRDQKDIEVTFIWSGQHYSSNLKDVFFQELNVAVPEIELGATGENDSEVSSDVIRKLFPVLEKINPRAVVFLGDTNTVMGCLSAAQLNIPIVHIEGCMRSYDWRMPEEKCRTVIDHLSDVIYTYFPEYKEQGVREGLNPNSIVVVENLIVDVLKTYYFDKLDEYENLAKTNFFTERNLEKDKYFLATCHRRENVENKTILENIMKFFGSFNELIYFPASYRTQKNLKRFQIDLPKNVKLVDPIGYKEMLMLMVNSKGVITDSGTVVEETAVLNIPSIQMRKSTERPQVYDCRSSVKVDPEFLKLEHYNSVRAKFDVISNSSWEHRLGDGLASKRIVDDLVLRIKDPNGFRNHTPEKYHLPIGRSFIDDGIVI
jgi:UDP-N-acetylglucosamine 2-epimerase (non-hydrolysing)